MIPCDVPQRYSLSLCQSSYFCFTCRARFGATTGTADGQADNYQAYRTRFWIMFKQRAEKEGGDVRSLPSVAQSGGGGAAAGRGGDLTDRGAKRRSRGSRIERGILSIVRIDRMESLRNRATMTQRHPCITPLDTRSALFLNYLSANTVGSVIGVVTCSGSFELYLSRMEGSMRIRTGIRIRKQTRKQTRVTTMRTL